MEAMSSQALKPRAMQQKHTAKKPSDLKTVPVELTSSNSHVQLVLLKNPDVQFILLNLRNKSMPMI